MRFIAALRTWSVTPTVPSLGHRPTLGHRGISPRTPGDVTENPRGCHREPQGMSPRTSGDITTGYIPQKRPFGPDRVMTETPKPFDNNTLQLMNCGADSCPTIPDDATPFVSICYGNTSDSGNGLCEPLFRRVFITVTCYILTSYAKNSRPFFGHMKF